MELEDIVVDQSDDCHLVPTQPKSTVKVIQPRTTVSEAPNAKLTKITQTGISKWQVFHEVEGANQESVQDTASRRWEQKLMVIMLTTACVVNLAVTGIGIAYLRLHFAREQVLSQDTASGASPGSDVGVSSLYNNLKAMILESRQSGASATARTPTTANRRRTRRRKTQWTSGLRFLDNLLWAKASDSSTEPTLFKKPNNYGWA